MEPRRYIARRDCNRDRCDATSLFCQITAGLSPSRFLLLSSALAAATRGSDNYCNRGVPPFLLNFL